MQFKNLTSMLFNKPWLIQPEKLEAIVEFAELRLEGKLTDAQIREAIELQHQTRNEPMVGVLPIYGTLMPKADFMTQMSGGASVESLQAAFKSMVSDDSISSIVLEFDSPGGSADLIEEFGNTIFEARGTKPIIAVGNTMIASGALWLASQADEVYMTPSGQIGSLGVFGVHVDTSQLEEKMGIDKTFVTAKKSPYKTELHHGPLSDSAREYAQNSMDEMYDKFASAVARGRNTDVSNVEANYGQGRMLKADAALTVGMIDGIKTFDEVVAEAFDTSATRGALGRPSTQAREGSNMNEGLLKLCAALGIEVSDDDTEETLVAKASQLNALISPLREVKAEGERVQTFQTQFPDEYARMQELTTRGIQADASQFASNYERFVTERSDGTKEVSTRGYASIALDEIEASHIKAASGQFDLEALTSLMDTLTTTNAVVEYEERGSSRPKELPDVDPNANARQQMNEVVLEVMKEDGIPYMQALQIAAERHPDLAEAYRKPLVAPGS